MKKFIKHLTWGFTACLLVLSVNTMGFKATSGVTVKAGSSQEYSLEGFEQISIWTTTDQYLYNNHEGKIKGIKYDDKNNITYTGTTQILLLLSLRAVSDDTATTTLYIKLNGNEVQRCHSADETKFTGIECNLVIRLKHNDTIKLEFKDGAPMYKNKEFSLSKITKL
jgi:hypothetical protein